MKKFKKDGLYHIWLNDIGCHHGWFDIEDVPNEINIKPQEIVGFYVDERKGFIILASGYNPDKNFKTYGHIFIIPKGCVIKTKHL